MLDGWNGNLVFAFHGKDAKWLSLDLQEPSEIYDLEFDLKIEASILSS